MRNVKKGGDGGSRKGRMWECGNDKGMRNGREWGEGMGERDEECGKGRRWSE